MGAQRKKRWYVSEERYWMIRRMLDAGRKPQEIADFCGCNVSTVHRIGRTKTYEDYKGYLRELAGGGSAQAEQITLDCYMTPSEKALNRIADALERIEAILRDEQHAKPIHPAI